MSGGTDARIAEWRAAVLRGRTVTEADADELEEHLRDQIDEFTAAGLTDEEAVLIAIGRLGRVDSLSAEFARVHGDRMWKQLALTHTVQERHPSLWVMLGFTLAVALLVQVVHVVALDPEAPALWFPRTFTLLVLPVLAGYFAVVRRLRWPVIAVLIAIVAVLAVAVSVFPFGQGSTTDILVAIHLPVVLWFVVGVAYVGGDIRSSARRMDFVRFSGEWLIYYALIALGGGVLVGLTTLILSPIAPATSDVVIPWIIPSGIAGAVIVAAWLVEAKKSVIENLAPVLTAVFTPLFVIMLVAATVVYLVAGVGRTFDRDLLTVFDVLLIVVMGLVVYGISARGTRERGVMDVLHLIAVIAAIVLDALVLVSLIGRVGEYGFTANRVAALVLNLLLLVNLAASAWHLLRVVSRRAPAAVLERFQTDYVPVFGVWAAVVVLLLPPLFGFA